MAVIKGMELLNSKEVISEIKGIMKKHRIVCQKVIAETMTRARKRAEEYIIPNITGFYNPYRASRKQFSTPGRLTSRTGKLKLMLKSHTSPSNPLRDWTGFGYKLASQKSIALQSYVRVKETSTLTESYEGTIRVQILGGDQRLFDTTRGQPVEALKTLAVRFNWETGIRGVVRPIMSPVTKQVDFDLTKLMEEKNDKIWRLH